MSSQVLTVKLWIDCKFVGKEIERERERERERETERERDRY